MARMAVMRYNSPYHTNGNGALFISSADVVNNLSYWVKHPAKQSNRSAVRVMTSASFAGCFVMTIKRICPNCGKENSVPPSRAKTTDNTFCNKNCFYEYTHVTCSCETCGKSFVIKRSHSDKEGTYCSRGCMAKGYSKNLRGDNNPNYRHGQAHTAPWYKEMSKRYRERHPDKVKHNNRLAKARRKKSTGDYTNQEFLELCSQYNNRCLACGRDDVKLTPDHIVPLTWGGSNRISNIQPLCISCNSSKGNRRDTDYRTKPSILRWIQKRLL